MPACRISVSYRIKSSCNTSNYSCESLLGAEHLDTLESMQNLATSYRSQGRYEQAALLGEQPVEVRKRGLGAEHPATVESMYNLALSYHS